MKRLFALMIMAMLIFTAGCSSKDHVMDGPGMVYENKYTQISQEEAKDMMTADDGHVVVDVRRLDEYEAGHIPGAILIPNETITDTPPAELPDKYQVILIYCRSGNRSKQAAQKLADMGYTNVYEFGGINTWTGEIVTGAEAGQASGGSEAAGGTEAGQASGGTDPAAQNTDKADPAVLTFSSFDGGGPEYNVVIDDPGIVAYEISREYFDPNHEELDGAAYTVNITFTGLAPGSTDVTIEARSPITKNYDMSYEARVDNKLNVRLEMEDAITSFALYRNGSVYYDSYDIVIIEDDYCVSVNGGDYQEIDDDALEAIYRLVEKYDLYKWNGFNKSDPEVLDGEGFSLEITLADGRSIYAQGNNSFPENYFDVIGKMQEILDNAEIGDH